MLHHDSDVKTYKSIANKSVRLVTAVSMVGAFGGFILQNPYAYASEDQTEVRPSGILITDPYAIILELIDVPTGSVVTHNGVLAFLAEHNIDRKGFEAITSGHLSSFDAAFAQEICRLQALLKPNASADPGTSPDVPATQPSQPSQPSVPSDDSSSQPSHPSVPTDQVEVPNPSPIPGASSDDADSLAPSWEAEEAAILPMITEGGLNSGDIVYPQWSYSGNTSFSVNPQASIGNSALVALLGENMRDICQEKGLYASVILAQVILDANSYDCDFAPFQNKVFFSEDQAPEADELAKLNEGYDTSKRFKNRFENCSDMVDYLEDYADFLSGDMPYTNHQLVAAQNLYRQTLQTQADVADAADIADVENNAGADGGIDADDNCATNGKDADAISLDKADIAVTPREAADAASAPAGNIDAAATANSGAYGTNAVNADTSDADTVEADEAPESLVLTQEQMDAAYSDMLDSIPASYQEACFWLEQTFDCDEGYAVSLLETIDKYDLTRYDQMRTYRLQNTIEMPVKDDDGNTLYDEKTHEPIMREATLVDLMDEVISHLGEPYVWGGTTPGAFDCSGLVQYAYSKALGTSIPRTTYYQCLQGQDVDFEDLQMGDLVFFANSKGICTHVGIYLGEDCYIEAPHTGDVVKVTSMADKTPTFAKRILATEDVTYTFSLSDDADASSDASDDASYGSDVSDVSYADDETNVQSNDTQSEGLICDGMQVIDIKGDDIQIRNDDTSDLSEINDLSALFDSMLGKRGFGIIDAGLFGTYGAKHIWS